MNRPTILTVLATMALVATSVRALAQTTPIYASQDQPTGATVRVTRAQTGPKLEIDAPTLSLSKELTATRTIVTTLRDRNESLRIEVTENAMVVTGARGRVTAPAGDVVAAERARVLVAQSPLSKRAASLIGKMDLGAATPIAPLLLTTRAFLLMANGDASGVRDLNTWMASRTRAVVRLASLPVTPQKSSTQCYDEYSNELLAAYDQFTDCMKNIKWYDPFFPVERCEVTYETRILAAFAAWMHCIGVTDPIGN